MGPSAVGRWGVPWFVGWVLWCVPVGVLAGAGLVEFNWGGPPYDGGFVGELVLFGGFLALGQAPLLAYFLRRLSAGDGGGRRSGGPVGMALSWWPLAGFVGWTLGSYLEVALGTPLYSNARVLAGGVPWLVAAAMQAVVWVPVSGGRARDWVRCYAVWVPAGGVGGLLYEYWRSFDVAVRENAFNNMLGLYLEGVGVAENVAYVVVPTALFLPLLYGVPTGLALVAIRGVLRRGRSSGGDRVGLGSSGKVGG